MAKSMPTLTSLAGAFYIFCLAASPMRCQITHENSSPQESAINGTCSSEDLNHSVLVECSATGCGGRPAADDEDQGVSWPANPREIIHIQSTRAGERFTQTRLPNLMVTENHTTKLLNINTTLNVRVPEDPSKEQLVGFGATLNGSELSAALQQDSFESLYCLVLDDLFSLAGSSAQTNLLRLTIDRNFVEGKHNLSELLLALDRQPRRHSASSRAKIKLLIEFDSEWTLERKLGELAEPALTNVQVWAIALQISAWQNQPVAGMANKILEVLPGVTLIACTPMASEPNTPHGSLTSDTKRPYSGILVKAQPSVPYEALEDFVRDPGLFVLSLEHGQLKTQDYGDWYNSHHFAVQVLNHLRHGSLGFIEDLSVVDVLAASSDVAVARDASIYSLHRSHGIHFRGPRFYALGHFSRYLKPGSSKLETNLFTQPNMFAAHYAAFLSADRKHVVGIVLNDNEHLLPFRMAVNDLVMAFTGLQPKSFNTFLIKLRD